MSIYSSDRPEFAERVARLAGQTTYRVPTEGRGTRTEQLPDAHAIAAALAFARQGPDDIGPDIAADIATGRRGHGVRVCAALGRSLSGDRSALMRRMRPYLAIAAADAYGLVVDGRRYARPPEARAEDWDTLVAAGAAILERLAWDALAEAERRYHRAA